ncbi:hypothetical protein COOONC_12418 [Cooperia oncophora]
METTSTLVTSPSAHPTSSLSSCSILAQPISGYQRPLATLPAIRRPNSSRVPQVPLCRAQPRGQSLMDLVMLRECLVPILSRPLGPASSVSPSRHLLSTVLCLLLSMQSIKDSWTSRCSPYGWSIVEVSKEPLEVFSLMELLTRKTVGQSLPTSHFLLQLTSSLRWPPLAWDLTRPPRHTK